MDELENAAGAKVPAKAVDRVALGKEEAEKVSAWLKQLEDSTSGFLQLSRSDIVNHLIREHKPDISPREMQQIRTHHYDPIRHLNWITPRLKEALKSGDVAVIASLQGEIKSIELSVISKAKGQPGASERSELSAPKLKRRRTKKSVPMDLVNESSFTDGQTDPSEG
jgi:hypothetical protein